MRSQWDYLVRILILLFAVCAYSNCATQKAVNTSHEVLIETGRALASMDKLVSRKISIATNDSIKQVRQEMELEAAAYSECLRSNVIEEYCEQGISDPMDLYANKMEEWNRLTEYLEVMSELLHTWDRVNTLWRKTGRKPDNWDADVCLPLAELLEAIQDSLSSLRVDIPPPIRTVIAGIPTICSVGGSLFNLDSEGEEGDE